LQREPLALKDRKVQQDLKDLPVLPAVLPDLKVQQVQLEQRVLWDLPVLPAVLPDQLGQLGQWVRWVQQACRDCQEFKEFQDLLEQQGQREQLVLQVHKAPRELFLAQVMSKLLHVEQRMQRTNCIQALCYLARVQATTLLASI
jgi:hypothetical protein